MHSEDEYSMIADLDSKGRYLQFSLITFPSPLIPRWYRFRKTGQNWVHPDVPNAQNQEVFNVMKGQ